MKAIYVGSFNLFHDGHKDIVQQALKLFDYLYIVIGKNSTKEFVDNINYRVEIIKLFLADLDQTKFEIIVNLQELTANFAKKLNVKFLVRGIRNANDADYEIAMADINNFINNDVQTILFISKNKNRKLSSTMLKDIDIFKN